MVLNALLLPIRRYVFDWQAKQEQLEKDIKVKFVDVPRERLKEEASLHLVVPAVQAWRYSINCDELRNLYANLLANALIKDKEAFVHPGFVEVIRQLHPNDELFVALENCENHLVVEIRLNGIAKWCLCCNWDAFLNHRTRR